MKKKAKKLSKAKLWSIISSCAVALIAAAILITNAFIPVKYLAGYLVSGKRAEIGVMRVSFVDVGYGDCTIVELPDGKNMLIDAGNGRYTNNSRVIKVLNRRGIDTIDYLVCSSVNNEHCGGLSEIMKYKKVKTVFMPYCKNKYVTDGFRRFYDGVKSSGAEVIYSQYNAGAKADDYFFTFLSPSVIGLEGGEYSQLNENPTASARNNSSAVIWLEFGETAFLFTSDVEAAVLNSVALSYEVAGKDYPAALEKCKIVQVANHGGETSACAAFYDAISPEAAVISVGDNGAASVKVLSDVMNSVGENLYRTDELGTVTVEVTQSGYKFNRGNV